MHFFSPPASKPVYRIAQPRCQSRLFVVLRVPCDPLALAEEGKVTSPRQRSEPAGAPAPRRVPGLQGRT